MNLSRSIRGALLWAVLALMPIEYAQAQYRVGDIVSTNFGFVNRYRWTNDNGQVFPPGSTFRLKDFDGKLVFFIFFDVW